MRWEAWVLVTFYVAATLTAIAAVGEEREPATPRAVAVGTAANLAFVLLVLRLGGAL